VPSNWHGDLPPRWFDRDRPRSIEDTEDQPSWAGIIAATAQLRRRTLTAALLNSGIGMTFTAAIGRCAETLRTYMNAVRKPIQAMRIAAVLLDMFANAQLPSTPYAYAVVDVTGETTIASSRLIRCKADQSVALSDAGLDQPAGIC
jgi:hypothetical protein